MKVSIELPDNSVVLINFNRWEGTDFYETTITTLDDSNNERSVKKVNMDYYDTLQLKFNPPQFRMTEEDIEKLEERREPFLTRAPKPLPSILERIKGLKRVLARPKKG